MKVMCIEDRIKIEASYESENVKSYIESFRIIPDKLWITKGKKYLVLGLEYKDLTSINVIIQDDLKVLYPKTYPLEFFEIVDKRISTFWGIDDIFFPISPNKFPSTITINILRSDSFWNSLFNGNSAAQKKYEWCLDTMNNEFQDPSYLFAESIGDNWYLCSYCNQALQNNSKYGAFSCPNCSKQNNNPNSAQRFV